MSSKFEATVEKQGDYYVIKVPADVVEKMLRWREGDKVTVEMSEWRGRLVLVVYKR